MTRAALDRGRAVSARRLPRPSWLLVAALVGPTLLRLPAFFEPHWYGDEGIFAVVARQILQGDVLYADVWDHKPPFIFLLYGLLIAIFGDSIVALRLAATLSVLATQVLIFAIGLVLLTPARAASAAGVYGVLMAVPVLEGQLALTEVFMVAFSAAGIAAYVRSRAGRAWDTPLPVWTWALIGLMFGLGSGFKPVAFFDLAAVGAFAVLHERQWLRALALMAGGASLPWLGFATVFVLLGALPAFIDANFTFQLAYVRASPAGMGVLFLMLAAPALALWMAIVLRPRRELIALPVLWLGFGMAGAMIGGSPYPHYLIQAFPALGLVIAMWPGMAERRLAVPAAALALVLVLTAHSFMGVTSRESREFLAAYYRSFFTSAYAATIDEFHDVFGNGWTKTRGIADAVNEMDVAGEKVMVWGARPWVYALSDLRPASKYMTWYHVLGDEAREAEVMDALREDEPVLIVLESGVRLFPALQAFIDEGYECEAAAEFATCTPKAADQPGN